jgi:hypothetical protein
VIVGVSRSSAASRLPERTKTMIPAQTRVQKERRTSQSARSTAASLVPPRGPWQAREDPGCRPPAPPSAPLPRRSDNPCGAKTRQTVPAPDARQDSSRLTPNKDGDGLHQPIRASIGSVPSASERNHVPFPARTVRPARGPDSGSDGVDSRAALTRRAWALLGIGALLVALGVLLLVRPVAEDVRVAVELR